MSFLHMHAKVKLHTWTVTCHLTGRRVMSILEANSQALIGIYYILWNYASRTEKAESVH